MKGIQNSEFLQDNKQRVCKGMVCCRDSRKNLEHSILEGDLYLIKKREKRRGGNIFNVTQYTLINFLTMYNESTLFEGYTFQSDQTTNLNSYK